MISQDVAVDNDHQSSLKIKNDASVGVKTPKTLNDALENSYMRSAKPYVIVAIPAFNEEIAIGSVVLRSKKYADEVIVIDDGSKDQTAEIATMAGAKVLPHLNNGGKGAAIKDAFAYAKKANADVLILIDGDGQHNPDEIPVLLAPIFKGDADIVNGSRFLANTSEQCAEVQAFWAGSPDVRDECRGEYEYHGYAEWFPGILEEDVQLFLIQTEWHGDRKRNAHGCHEGGDEDQRSAD